MHEPELEGDNTKANFWGLPNRPAVRYAVAVGAAVVALAFRGLLDPLLGDTVPYITLFAGVALSAWYCGAGPAILTTFLGLLGAVYWFFPPTRGFGAIDRPHIFGIMAYLCFSAVIVVLGEANRRSHRRLYEARQELEQRVQERTRELEIRNLAVTKQSEVVRDLSARLLRMQDEERRRIARELHDSVGQWLAALKMNIEMMSQSLSPATAAAKGLADNTVLIDQISREIRTISHLLHPPMLDEVGLASALQWYTDGFSERSQIQITLEMPPDLARLPRDLELCIFRIVQEALTNVHRHSGSTIGKVLIRDDKRNLRVEIQDHGSGIPADLRSEFDSGAKTGVGIRGMRERIRQLGGHLEIRSDETGTIVSAIFPSDGAPGLGTDNSAAAVKFSQKDGSPEVLRRTLANDQNQSGKISSTRPGTQ